MMMMSSDCYRDCCFFTAFNDIHNNGPRTGRFNYGCNSENPSSLVTPAALLHTQRGTLCPLTLETQQYLHLHEKEAAALRWCVRDFNSCNSNGIGSGSGSGSGSGNSKDNRKKNDFMRTAVTMTGGVHTATNMNQWMMFATPDAAAGPLIRASGSSGSLKLTHDSIRGRVCLSTEEYMNAYHCHGGPDALLLLHDPSLPDGVSSSRSKKILQRSLTLLDQALDHMHAAAAIAAASDGEDYNPHNKEKVLSTPMVFVPLLGGNDVDQRRWYSEQVAHRCFVASDNNANVGGVAVVGLGGHSTESAMRAAVLPLPPTLPRVALGTNSPLDMLAAIAAGADLIDSPWPYFAASTGHALTFTFGTASTTTECNTKEFQISLWDANMTRDVRPLASGCICFSCQHHHRAYVHHLLETHEMLAEVLLTLHNTHIIVEFFRCIRDSIDAGNFNIDREMFTQRYTV